MIYRTIGSSGIEASVIGLGTFPLGGWMWGGIDESAAIDSIHCALDHGINLIDTAPLYGYGLAEELIGKAITGRKRENIVIATKCGLRFDRSNWSCGEGEHHFYYNEYGITEDTRAKQCRRFLRADSIMKEAEDSLRRLRTDYIDVYFTHAPDATTPIEETVTALVRLKEQGKIRAIGCSNVSAGLFQKYLNQCVLDANQERLSLIDQTVLHNGLFDLCNRNKVSFFAYSPLENGLLTGEMQPDRKYPGGDLRKDSPRFSAANIRNVNALLNGFDSLKRKYAMTTAQLVLSWIVSQNSSSHVLCGMRSRRSVEANVAAGNIILTGSERDFMTARAQREQFVGNDLVFDLASS
ncbi:MAG: aldo/keto reductase [Thermoguttaceae bacterium]|nr:aldo/keto reductase [Thermoguttaceae bacterium]